MDYLRKHYSLLDILMLFAIVFIGSDIYGVDIAGMHFRIVQFYLVGVFCFIIFNHKYRLYLPLTLMIFGGLFLISSVLAINLFKGVIFDFWLIYNIFFVFSLFYTYIRIAGREKFIDIFRYSLFIIFICAFVSFALGNVLHILLPFFSYQEHLSIVRTALWFYEPSYLASFACIYFAFAIYNLFVNEDKKYIYDTLYSALTIIFTTSSTGFIALGLGVVLVCAYRFITMETLKMKVLSVLISILIILIMFCVVYFALPKVYNVFVKRLFVDGLFNASGGRMREYSTTFEVFKNNFLFGIGPNCYGAYFNDTTDTVQATNITLELLATTGIFTTLAFYLFYMYPCKVFFKKGKNHFSSKSFVFALIMFIIILQANQNYMRLYLWMLVGICYAFINEDSNEIKECGVCL